MGAMVKYAVLLAGIAVVGITYALWAQAPELDDDGEWARNPQYHEDFCRESARSQPVEFRDTYLLSCIK
jgi:hypothetical protein